MECFSIRDYWYQKLLFDLGVVLRQISALRDQVKGSQDNQDSIYDLPSPPPV